MRQAERVARAVIRWTLIAIAIVYATAAIVVPPLAIAVLARIAFGW